MWRARSDQSFVLTGKFKDLVIAVLGNLLDEFFFRCRTDPDFLEDVFDETEEDPDDLFYMQWHQPFESLSNRDKIVLFARVVRALLDPETPQPALSQYNESAVFAIFESIYAAVEEEIDYAKTTREQGEDPYEIRRLVAIVEKEHVYYDEEYEGQESPYVDYTSDDVNQWYFVVEGLAELILWDLDFIEPETGLTIADASPEVAALTKQMLGIEPDYYVQPVELVTRDQFLDAVEFLLQTLITEHE